MTDPTRVRRLFWSLTAWWILLATGLWLLGQATNQSASPTACAASAAFLLAIGEAGDWLRRRRHHYRTTRRFRRH
ncbi:hypothetical protein OG342_06365 [Streptomyces bobili]|uniref:hypothetical protein n=1 Tax=Streptomyces bobili TaxID=67280 RepID=UPI00225AECF9|nr:hypothetical protein [Streptomyces bobili]MCX5522489.1 hypothetical protein [Streptomyces bobili]